jgi:hypothetical protein
VRFINQVGKSSDSAINNQFAELISNSEPNNYPEKLDFAPMTKVAKVTFVITQDPRPARDSAQQKAAGLPAASHSQKTIRAFSPCRDRS